MKKIVPQFFEITDDKLHFTRSGKKINLKEYDEVNSCVKMSNNMTALISRRRKEIGRAHV